MTSLTLESPAFDENKVIPPIYTCDGADINPPLIISGVPQGAKSLVLIMEDPDVPKHLEESGMWDHWIKFNIPPETTEIKEGIEPVGVSGRGTSGNLSYLGPCPPDREHRYFFKLYALDTMLDLKEGSSKQQVLRASIGHIIDEAEVIGRYDRRIY